MNILNRGLRGGLLKRGYALKLAMVWQAISRLAFALSRASQIKRQHGQAGAVNTSFLGRAALQALSALDKASQVVRKRAISTRVQPRNEAFLFASRVAKQAKTASDLALAIHKPSTVVLALSNTSLSIRQRQTTAYAVRQRAWVAGVEAT